jgi:hypothetical protein
VSSRHTAAHRGQPRRIPDRPAVTMTVLRPDGPRVLGGRDEQSGGTWLAVNEHGVFAGSHQPASGRRPRSRPAGPGASSRWPTWPPTRRPARRRRRPLDRHRPLRVGLQRIVAARGDRDGTRSSCFFIDFTGLVDGPPWRSRSGQWMASTIRLAMENRVSAINSAGPVGAKADHMIASPC